LGGDHLARHPATAHALAHRARVDLEQHRMGGDAVALGQRQPGRPPLGVQAGRVDDGGQAATHALGHDELEHLERVLAGAHVVLAGADHGAQPVRGHDLVGREPLRRPVRLARAGRADQHHETWVGQADGHAATAPGRA